MLKGLDPLLVPPLLSALAEMGHGDLLAVVDRNFPAHSCGGSVIELPGPDASGVLRAVLTLLPVDAFQDPAAWHMIQDDGTEGPAAADVHTILEGFEHRSIGFSGLARSDFYARAADAYCTIRTGETRPYGCFLIAKGVVAG